MLLELLESAIGFHKRFLHDLFCLFPGYQCLPCVVSHSNLSPDVHGKSRLSKTAACRQIIFGSIDRKIDEHPMTCGGSFGDVLV
jgi:hypothetical protein